jgi:hypothetical protein
VTDTAPELPPVPQAEREECEICGKVYEGPMAASRLRTHKFGAFSKHKLKADGKPSIKPDKVIPSRQAAPSKSKARGPRKDASTLLSGVWTAAAMTVVPGFSPAASRAMMWQAEAAGPVLDGFIANTFIDKIIIQKVAGKTEEAKSISGLIGLPLLLGWAERKPQLILFDPFYKAVEYAVKCSFETIADAKIKEKQEEERWGAKLEAAGIPREFVDEKGNKTDVVTAMTSELLGDILTRAKEAAEAMAA